MEKTFSNKLKKKQLNAGKIVSVSRNATKNNAKWKKVDVSQVINRNFPTLGIMSFEEIDPSDFFGKKSSDAQSKRKRTEPIAEDSDTITQVPQQQPEKPKRSKRITFRF